MKAGGIASLAARQHGVVSRHQLLRLGLSRSEISRDVAAGRLHRVFRGVYAVGYARDDRKARMRAATLACGEGTVVSHRSAAALLGLIDRAPVVVDVIAPGSRGRAIDGIRAHRVPLPATSETGTVDGIPCASPARVLVDIAAEVRGRTLRSAFERAAARGVLDVKAVEAIAARPVRGAAAARRLAGEWRQAAPVAHPGRLKSPLEAMVLPLVVAAGAEPPRVNAPVRLADGTTIEVDFLWPAHRLALEADSRDFHATDVAFERDRRRDRELLRIGYSTLRVTRRQAETEPAAVAAAVIARLREA
ncbi:MAG: type IV toxin-antitoxin system AbiEi family antitoxin domain-containing protein [Solirubrobacterales bacterium]